MSDYHVPLDGVTSNVSKWYFVAVSGAETKHFTEKQNKPENKYVMKLRPQLDIFNQITDTVDYVTLTIGGNDVKFADVIKKAVLYSYSIGGYKKFEKYLEDIWATRFDTLANIKETYKKIEQAAGKQATILVAGYPTLVNSKGCIPIHEKHAKLINEKVNAFNGLLAGLVEECQGEGMNIEFVDVATSFKGHEAYTDDNWINKISTRHDDDIPKDGVLDVVSAYSMHPNEKGVEEYARLVNLAIEKAEEEKSVEVDYRIVLKWGENPSDLDANMEGTLSNGNAFHADFRQQTIMDGDDVICLLDIDKMMRHGPETINLDVRTDKPYYYYVYRYRGAGKLQTSEAIVEVYKDGVLAQVFNVPTENADGDYWNVFAIVNGEIVSGGTITEEADTQYANE